MNETGKHLARYHARTRAGLGVELGELAMEASVIRMTRWAIAVQICKYRSSIRALNAAAIRSNADGDYAQAQAYRFRANTDTDAVASLRFVSRAIRGMI